MTRYLGIPLVEADVPGVVFLDPDGNVLGIMAGMEGPPAEPPRDPLDGACILDRDRMHLLDGLPKMGRFLLDATPWRPKGGP